MNVWPPRGCRFFMCLVGKHTMSGSLRPIYSHESDGECSEREINASAILFSFRQSVLYAVGGGAISFSAAAISLSNFTGLVKYSLTPWLSANVL